MLRKISILLLSLIVTSGTWSQKMESIDFAKVWTSENSNNIVGFIGDDFRRIQVHILSVIKDVDNPLEYFVHGKTMVYNNVCDFQGKIVLEQMLEDKEPAYKGEKAYILRAKYKFLEDPAQNHVGTFEGMIVSYILLKRRRKVEYNDLLKESDAYNNNVFIGNWTQYRKKKSKVCNWGDYRVPQSGDLDVGSSNFEPNEKYFEKGWKNFSNQPTSKTDIGWWK